MARNYMRLRGYRIVARNVITGKGTHSGEIDFIACRGTTLVFVEVKKRKDVMTAWGAITPAQQRRLRLAAETYLLQRRWTGDARFDVIIVHGRHIDWTKNAF